MNKKLSVLIGVISMLVFCVTTANVYAAGNISLKVAEPKTPTNQQNFTINYVAMDILGRTIDVACLKKGPSDAAYNQFGSTVTLTAGGNSGNCDVNSSVLAENGTYSFKVQATAGSDVVSDTVSVQYDNSGPGDPRDYSKEKISNCEYKIHFKTSDDSGATVKVEVYRSENTSFNTDDGTRVGTVGAGSNEAHDFVNGIPECDKTYYYAIRSFDSAGNGSGVVGDSVITVTTVETTSAPAQGAIVIGEGSVLGTEAGESTPTEATGETLGDATPQEATPGITEGVTGAVKGTFTNPLIWGILGVALLAYYYARTKKKQS